ncbi:hypothetical protein ACMFMG_010142 [Clarireedia jacksonii]
MPRMVDYAHPIHPKRLILCCDGTWMDSDSGFTNPSLIPYQPTGALQVASNITRISRAFKRYARDGTHQIIYYHSGVGTGSSMIDTLSGGMLGTGISENIREAYSFIAANYAPGDEIILVGFSRGAFTARSVAGMIKDIGLLTREGMNNFYAIFKDQENFRNDDYRDIFPETPFPNKPKNAADYKKRLEREDLTRVCDPDGKKIVIQAVAVWDTVGSLGIPNIALLSKLGLPHSTKEYKFFDTNLSGSIRHAFQALALDEHRRPFSPAVWEVRDMENATDLRQVWFPGSHSNVGGGYEDQEIANVTLAWMMDQLASIGVAFHDEAIETIFEKSVQYYESLREPSNSIGNWFSRKPKQQWATQSVYDKHHPVRPWGLGKIYNSDTGIWLLAGKKTRTPGLYTRPDPNTGMPTGIPMTHTNERIHSSVRIRLELEGLGEDDLTKYECPALLKKGPWRLDQIRIKVNDPIPPTATWGPSAPAALDDEISDMRWVWEYDGPEHNAPPVQTMIEENLGPFERKLLLLNKGRASYEKYTTRKRRKKKRRKRYEDEKGHMGDDLLEAIGGETAVNGEFGVRREEVVSYGSVPITVDADDEEIDEKLARKHRDYGRSRRSKREIEEEEEALEAKLARMEMDSSYMTRGPEVEDVVDERIARMEMGSSAPRRRSHRDSTRERNRGKERDSYSYSSKRRSETTDDPYIIRGIKERVSLSNDGYGHAPEMGENYSEQRAPISHHNDEIMAIDNHYMDGHGQAYAGDNKRRSAFGSVGGGGGSDREYGDGTRESGDAYSYKEHRTHSPNPSRRGESRRDRRTWAERGARSSSSRQS